MSDPLVRPLLLWDGDCGFCRFWVERWRGAVHGQVDFAPSQAERHRFPDVPESRYAEGVVLVEPDGRTTYCAHAVLRALALGGHGFLYWLYLHVPGFAPVTEGVYGFIASHRMSMSWLTRLLWGGNSSPDRFGIGTWLFLRALGFISLCAHLSLWTQVHGLVGARGILPLEPWLDMIRERMGGVPWTEAPTLFWLGAGDRALDVVCALGVAGSVLLLLDLVPFVAALLAWACYLSLTIACRDFLTFQWDLLLLETLVLALLVVHLGVLPRRPRDPPVLARGLLWWLVFRLMFMSGVVKLASGDPAWRDLTAMSFHHETQPIPATLAWYLHQLPSWAHRLSTLGAFGVELVLPFLVMAPRRLRHLAALGFSVLMFAILASGNYGFFNLLAFALCLPLLDDTFFPRTWREFFAPREGSRPWRTWPRVVLVPVAIVIVALTVLHSIDRLDRGNEWPRPLEALSRAAAPFRSWNAYGLFAVMTKERPEIVIEGSDDGLTWRAYELPFKPGRLDRAPTYFVPHMPRLDWRLWFAALSPERISPWFPPLVRGLLEGSPEILDLFETNPFPDSPPRFIRARLLDYHFTTWKERSETGNWWRSEDRGVYLRPVQLGDFHN